MSRRVDLVTLVVLDGWGCAPPGPGNAVELARTPVFDRLWREYPHTTLAASGEAVGLPPGQMGNSEVGHLTIGSGRILFQDLQRVNAAVRDGSFFENPALVAAFERARERGGDVHLLGLVSKGGVHSHLDHLQALLELARRQGMEERTWIHAFTDGRDVSPTSAVVDLAELPPERLATVVGRYYAMDRDQRWERTQKALDAITLGDRHARSERVAKMCNGATTPGSRTSSWSRSSSTGAPRLAPGDAAIFFNFRPDRGRQLAQKLVEAGFDLTTMTRYSDELDVPVAFGEQVVEHTLAETLAASGRPPAARRRDGEVRPRHLLLQRRRRAGVAGGDADPRPEPARRAELRPQAGDVRARGRGALRRRDRQRLPVRGRSTSPTRTWSATRARSRP